MEFSVGRDYCVAYVMIMKEKERRTNTSEWSRPIREERRIFRHIRWWPKLWKTRENNNINKLP